MQIPDDFLKGEIRNSFYVENMMKSVWAAQIEVLNEVDKLCKKHGIQYFADWGTLLGAVRHKGFIPWDDDVDITMKRPDYERFCQIAEKELDGIVIYNIYTKDDCDRLTTRVVNGTRIRFDDEFLAKYHGSPWVVGLDLFPLDFIGPSDEEDEMRCQMMRIVDFFSNNMDDGTAEEIVQSAKQIEQMCGVTFDYNAPLKRQMLKLIDRLARMFTDEESDRIALMIDHAGPRPLDVYPKEYYSEAIMMPFEYTTIPVPVGYDAILRQKYGDDYMTPRVGAASHNYPFYMQQKRELYSQLGIKI